MNKIIDNLAELTDELMREDPDETFFGGMKKTYGYREIDKEEVFRMQRSQENIHYPNAL